MTAAGRYAGWPVGIMGLKILASFPAFRAQRVKVTGLKELCSKKMWHADVTFAMARVTRPVICITLTVLTVLTLIIVLSLTILCCISQARESKVSLQKLIRDYTPVRFLDSLNSLKEMVMSIFKQFIPSAIFP